MNTLPLVVNDWLPIAFAAIMGFALLMYAILDGYDLGIGILLPLGKTHDTQDNMIASIGPFWDANETWLVLGIGVLLIAFPSAYGTVLTTLYLPVTLMLLGLILRGVAFDFRVKAGFKYKHIWSKLFFVGSLLASMTQGWMLGRYIVGFSDTGLSLVFAGLVAITLPAIYVMLGVGWLVLKSETDLQAQALKWGRYALFPMVLALLLISIATPISSPQIAAKWFSLPEMIGLAPIPITTGFAVLACWWALTRKHIVRAGYGWLIFVSMVVICVMAAIGLAYSIFPYIIPNQSTMWEAAASRASLQFTFYGAIVAVPAIFGYTVWIYKVFHGKTAGMHYD